MPIQVMRQFIEEPVICCFVENKKWEILTFKNHVSFQVRSSNNAILFWPVSDRLMALKSLHHFGNTFENWIENSNFGLPKIFSVKTNSKWRKRSNRSILSNKVTGKLINFWHFSGLPGYFLRYFVHLATVYIHLRIGSN